MMKERTCIISMECYGNKVIYEIDHCDTTIDEMLKAVATCLIGTGWSESQIISGMKDYIDENSDESIDEIY